MSSLPPLGTGFSDGTRAGPQVKSGIYTGTPGAPISPLFVYDIVPQPAAPDNIAVSAVRNAGTTLYPANGLVNSGNSGTNTVTTFPTNQQAIVLFDCDRAIQITTIAGGAANTFTFYGIDIYENFVTKTMSVPAAAGVYTSSWTMAGIFRVFVTGPTTTAISIGCADAFGLPYVAYSPNYLIPYFDGVLDNVTPPVLAGTSASLAGGPLVVANPNVSANSLIFTTVNIQTTATGYISAPSADIVPGVSFTLISSAGTETSTVNYDIVAPSYTAGTSTLAPVLGVAQFTVVNAAILPAVSLAPNVFSQIIRLGVNTLAGTPGFLSYTINPNGGSFTVASSNVADLSSVNWQILTVNGAYSGFETLVGAVTVLNSPVVNTKAGAQTLVFANYSSLTNPGFLNAPVGGLTSGVSYTVNSSSNTDASQVAILLKNKSVPGQYILPDMTNPATATSGDPRGIYIPSSPSNGFSRLTIWMYNRGVLNANATIGANPSDPLFANSNANLYGVANYTDNAH